MARILETDDPLWAALKGAYARWSIEAAARFPLVSKWEPPQGLVGPEKNVTDLTVDSRVPTVPAVPTEIHNNRRETQLDPAAEAMAAWDERAAIVEYDGGLSREEAERAATEALKPAACAHSRAAQRP